MVRRAADVSQISLYLVFEAAALEPRRVAGGLSVATVYRSKRKSSCSERSLQRYRTIISVETTISPPCQDVTRRLPFQVGHLISFNLTSHTDFPISGYASLRDYALQHAERSRLLQLLVENEMSRLSIWSNPIASRSQATFNGVEASVNAVSPHNLRVHCHVTHACV